MVHVSHVAVAIYLIPAIMRVLICRRTTTTVVSVTIAASVICIVKKAYAGVRKIQLLAAIAAYN
jgi:hypothetical protein